MEIVILIIMALVSFSFLLKLTCHGWKGRIALSVLAAVVVILTYNYAASQSKTQIADWLSQPTLMLDVSVLLTIDVVFQISFCVISAKSLSLLLSKTENILLQICLWIPGILIFPTLFAMVTELIFSFTGVDFAFIAWTTAGVLVCLLPLLAGGIKYIIPEKDIRLEMIFMVNLIIAALGIIATVNGRTAAVGESEIEWSALIGVALILIIGSIVGVLLNRYLIRKKISKTT